MCSEPPVSARTGRRHEARIGANVTMVGNSRLLLARSSGPTGANTRHDSILKTRMGNTKKRNTRHILCMLLLTLTLIEQIALS